MHITQIEKNEHIAVYLGGMLLGGVLSTYFFRQPAPNMNRYAQLTLGGLQGVATSSLAFLLSRLSSVWLDIFSQKYVSTATAHKIGLCAFFTSYVVSAIAISQIAESKKIPYFGNSKKALINFAISSVCGVIANYIVGKYKPSPS